MVALADSVSGPVERIVATARDAGDAPTRHTLRLGDARHLVWIPDASVHLVVTSPPYWTLKRYRDHPDQLGAVADYEAFHDELDHVWRHCFRALVPGGRLVCVVADIAVRCRRIGFDYLTPIPWHKIANASYEVENGSSFLGKPYEPNASSRTTSSTS